ncbi:MAG TPA: Uma2 family endonuclease [Ktedonobacterales bacterium]|nr:Uma2 family endonuclease [Ktedonobacterales bacterium]
MAMLQPTWGDIFEMPPATTADDLLRLPDDGYRNELYKGKLVREMTSAGHGGVCHRLSVELGIYARHANFLNAIVQNTLFDLTPPGMATRTVLAPDVAILHAGATQPWDTVPHEPPLLAVEVVSASQTLAELVLKAQTYRQARFDEVWVVDHTSRGIEVWSAHGTTLLGETQMLTNPLLPGFSVAVRLLLDD